MKISNTLLTILLLTLLSSPSWSTSINALVYRDGLYYPKFSEIPFTGEVTGKSQGSLKNGKIEGVWVTYYDNGQLLTKDNYKNGELEGLAVMYHDNGQLWSSSTYKNGKAEGDMVAYHRNGKLKFKGNFKNDKREDMHFFYNELGGLRSKDNYKDGVKISD